VDAQLESNTAELESNTARAASYMLTGHEMYRGGAASLR
jgi:hypothetical protein